LDTQVLPEKSIRKIQPTTPKVANDMPFIPVPVPADTVSPPQYDNEREPKPGGNRCPDRYMTGKFTSEHYLYDADDNYGLVKLEIHKQSAADISSYESEHFSLANIKNSPSIVLVAAMTAIVATVKLRKIFTSSSQQELVIIKERPPVQPSPLLLPPQQPPSFTPLPIPASLV
jgi:hypothetical protein